MVRLVIVLGNLQNRMELEEFESKETENRDCGGSEVKGASDGGNRSRGTELEERLGRPSPVPTL